MKFEKVQEYFKQLQYQWGVEDYTLSLISNEVHRDWKKNLNTGNILGYCDGNAKVIGLWKAFVDVNGPEEVFETLRHEVAHALCPPDAGHDELWEDMCRLVGAIPYAYSCDKKGIIPISVFGWYGLSRFINYYMDKRFCNCFRCIYGINKY